MTTVELVEVFSDWFQVLIDGEESGNLYQTEDSTWTVHIYSYYPSTGYNTPDQARDWVVELVNC